MIDCLHYYYYFFYKYNLLVLKITISITIEEIYFTHLERDLSFTFQTYNVKIKLKGEKKLFTKIYIFFKIQSNNLKLQIENLSFSHLNYNQYNIIKMKKKKKIHKFFHVE